MLRGALELVAIQQVLDILTHNAVAPLERKRRELAVHVLHGAVCAAQGNRIACELNQMRKLGELAGSHGFHRRTSRTEYGRSQPRPSGLLRSIPVPAGQGPDIEASGRIMFNR